MNRLTKWMLGIGITIWAVFFVTALFIYFYYDEPCENEPGCTSALSNDAYEAVTVQTLWGQQHRTA